jgi:hypothetical protein
MQKKYSRPYLYLTSVLNELATLALPFLFDFMYHPCSYRIAYLTQLETWKHEAEESQHSRNIRTHKADSPRNDMGKKESKEETPEI